MARKYARQVLPAQAAGTSSGATAIKTFDDNRQRRLVGVFIAGGAAGQHTQLDKAGTVYADLDHPMFGAGKGPLDADVTFEGGVQLSFNAIVDVGGTAIAAGTVILTVVYEVAGGVQGSP